HRTAARLDGHFILTAGALSSNPDNAALSGADLGLDPRRTYTSFETMAQVEAKREDGIDAVIIVTPNHMHFPVAKAFLEAGIHVICDKPMTSNMQDARALVELVERSGKLFVLTHNYSGYQMIRQAREMVTRGDLGVLRLVQVEYAQQWLTHRIEGTDHKQANWRTDPARSGQGGCIGDIGTHAFQLANFVTGETPSKVSAELTSFVVGRRLDDNVHVMMRYKSGARGMLWASQVAPGNENGLRLRLYGSRAGMEWNQEVPDILWLTVFGEPTQKLTRGGSASTSASQRLLRAPAGHPEGYIEGFSNIYAEAAIAIRAANNGAICPADVVFPGIRDGFDGMAFIDACVKSSTEDGMWMKLP
ncbi:MAG: Gfo/Idh/MocA family oxidoreductase, partial [Cohaesibacteraceae bacterium]|nr:Gfo/Idh/MocA family oxidoreductase [Cohaesibacteraceae bacterium]